MTLRPVTLLLLCTRFIALIAAEPARVREARQLVTISIQPVATPIFSIKFPTMPFTSTSAISSSPSPSPSSSSSSTTSSATPTHTPTPTPTPSMLNFTVQNMTTCTSGLISWNFTGTAAELLLSISSIDVPQDGAGVFTAQQSTINATADQQLADTNTSALSYTWPSVNFPQGWYQISGLVLSTPTFSNDSQAFFIANGTDVSCMAAFRAVTPSRTKVATLVGGIVGGVFTVILAFLAGMCWWWRRKRSRAKDGSKSQKWGLFKPNGSGVKLGNSCPRTSNNHFHAHSESTGPMLHTVEDGKASATSIDTPDGSDEDVVVVSDEKMVSPTSSPGVSAFDALNTPARYERRGSTNSVQTPASVASEASRSRVPSAPLPTLEQQAQRIRSSMAMEPSARRRSERLSMPTLPPPAITSRLPPSPTCIPPQEEYPLTPVNRTVSNGAVSISRRTSRKPVPHYDSSTLFEDKSPATTEPVPTSPAGAESPQTNGTAWGTGAHGTPSDLVRKASAGDLRPVHYLIPDMPSPQQDD